MFKTLIAKSGGVTGGSPVEGVAAYSARPAPGVFLSFASPAIGDADTPGAPAIALRSIRLRGAAISLPLNTRRIFVRSIKKMRTRKRTCAAARQ